MDTISRQAVIDILAAMQGRCTSKAALIQNSKIWQQIKNLPSAQPDIIHCKDCRYFKSTTSIHGECECGEMWQSLFGETTEVEAINVHKDHYCGYAERKAK